MTLNDGQLSDSAARIYAPPSDSFATITSIIFGNNDSTARTVTVSFKRTNVRKLFTFTIPAGGSAVIDEELGLRRGDEIDANADVAGQVDFCVQGKETSE